MKTKALFFLWLMGGSLAAQDTVRVSTVAALEAAIAQPGATVLAAPGTYRAQEYFDLAPGVTLVGASREGTVLQAPDGAARVVQLDSPNNTLKNLTVQGHGKKAVGAPGEGPTLIENVTVEGRDGGLKNGVSIAGSNVVMRGCTLRGTNEIGLYITRHWELWKPYGEAEKDRAAYEALGPLTCQNILVEECYFTDNAQKADVSWHGGATKFIPGVRDVTFRNNVIRDRKGIWFDHCFGDNVITGNDVEVDDVALHYEISNQMGRPTYVAGNQLKSRTKHALYVSASSNVTAEYNTLRGGFVGAALHGYGKGKQRGIFELKRNVLRRNVLDADVDLVVWAREVPYAGDNQVSDNVFLHPVSISRTESGGYGSRSDQTGAYGQAVKAVPPGYGHAAWPGTVPEAFTAK